MEHVKNQHTVPRLLLKNFSNENGTKIWTFDKEAIDKRWNNIKNRSIKNTPTEEFFYDRIVGQKDGSLEYKLAAVEDRAESIITE
jgi:hypothetical protein